MLPILVGGWSDRLRTRIGGRLPFILACAAFAIPALMLMQLFAGSLAGVAVTLALFLIGYFVYFAPYYFVYFAPYYALYPDLVPEEIRGRSQGRQGGLRAGGLMIGLAGGGLMPSIWQPLPFVVGAVAIAVGTVVLAVGIRRRLGQGEGVSRHRGNPFATTWSLVRTDRALRNWAIANTLWGAALAALRTFVALYLIRGTRALPGGDLRCAGARRAGRAGRGTRLGQAR